VLRAAEGLIRHFGLGGIAAFAFALERRKANPAYALLMSMPIPELSSAPRVSAIHAGAQLMKSMSFISGAAAAILICAVVTAFDASSVQARNAEGPKRLHSRSHRHAHVPPHHQPRRANAPDTAIEPTAKEQAVDRKINSICRGC
jgi:hypothetical protein